MKSQLLRHLFVTGFVCSMASTSAFAADASFSFSPAPANLAGDLSKDKLGLDVVTIQVDGASDITATTFRYLSKKSTGLPDSDKKSVAGLNYYLTTMSSADFDSALAFGFSFDGVGGSPRGSAFIFGMGMDMQTFSTSTAASSVDVLSLVTHLDLGVQNHFVLGPDLTMVPWGKYSYFYANSTAYIEYQDPFLGTVSTSSDSTASFGALSYGFDVLFHGFSLGAMYQQGDNSSITKFSISTDF